MRLHVIAQLIRDGKYRKMISAFYEALLNKKTSAPEAWRAALIAGQVPSLESLEKEWKDYVRDLAQPDPDSAFLGSEVDMDPERCADGTAIRGVLPDAPAAKAGLKEGDVVVKLDGKAVDLWNGFLAFLSTRKPGDRITLAVKRGDKNVEIPVVLEKRGNGR
jgi:S1-C subfamily serine protease